MSRTFVLPEEVTWRGEAPSEDQARIEEAVLRGVRRGIESSGGHRVDGERAGRPMRVSPLRVVRDGAGDSALIPSFGDGEEQVEVPIVAKEGAEGVVAPPPDSIKTAGGDFVYRSGFPSLPVIRIAGGGGDFVSTQAGAYARTKTLTRAYQWGTYLFGGSGFALLEPRGAFGTHGFFAVGLGETVPLSRFGGWESGAPPEAGDPGLLAKSGELIPLQDYTVVAVVTSDGISIVTLDRGDYWLPERFTRTLRAHVDVVDREDVRTAGRMLLGTTSEEGLDEEARSRIARMNRTAFAVLPWEQRARYLKLLIAGWTGEDEGNAIVEIFRATTKPTELDAIFGLLREWDLDRKVFNDLSVGTAYELLQVLGELRGGGPIDIRFFLSLLLELEGFSLSEPHRAVVGMTDWILSNLQGIWFMLSHPDDVLRAIPSLLEFVELISRAQMGDPQALLTIGQLLSKVGQGLVHAVRGAAYVEQLGRKYSERDDPGAAVAGDLIGRVRWALVLEVLSWFVGIGEVKAVVTGIRSGELAEKILAVLGRLGKLARGARALDAVAEVARLERTLVALSALAEISEEAKIARLAEHLTDRQLEALARIAEHANLPEGAGAEALKLALKSDRALAAEADALASALKVLGKVEEKLGGKIGAEAAAGLRRLMEHAPWSWEEALRFADRLPAENAEELLKALRNVEPKHFRTWSVEAFETLAQRPKAIRFLGEVGSDVFEKTFSKTGQSWQSYERFLEGVELYKAELGNPADYQRFLDRLAANDATAFEHALGARVRALAVKGGSAESASLLSRAVGDSGEALAKLSPDARKAAQVAADINPELARRIVSAEIEPQLERAVEELDAALYNAEMSNEDIEKTLQALKDLNKEHNLLREGEDVELAIKRIEELSDPKALRESVRLRSHELRRRAHELELAGNWERAQKLRQDVARLRRLAQEKGGLTDLAALQEEVRKSQSLLRHMQSGGQENLRRLWVQYWSRGKPPKVDFEEYVEILSRHFRGNLGEHEVAFRLGETHIFLKAPDRLVTLPGTDLVAIDRATGEVLLIDNKAFLSDEVDKVNALTRNLPKNLEMDLKDFSKLAGDEHLPNELQGAVSKLQKARDDIASKYGHLKPKQLEDPLVQKDIDDILRSNGVKRVVTNAGGQVRGLSDELLAIGIELMDLNL
jgi:hypothetical protein